MGANVICAGRESDLESARWKEMGGISIKCLRKDVGKKMMGVVRLDFSMKAISHRTRSVCTGGRLMQEVRRCSTRFRCWIRALEEVGVLKNRKIKSDRG